MSENSNMLTWAQAEYIFQCDEVIATLKEKLSLIFKSMINLYAICGH